MPRFAANLTMLYDEVSFLDRFDVAAKAGFKGVECQFPYNFTKESIAERLHANGLTHVLHNLPAGDWCAGERGITVLPDRTGEFQDGVGLAIEYAEALGCKQVNCLAGIAPVGVDPDNLRETFIGNLKFAADKLKAAGIRLLVEALNTRDMPNFYLHGTRQAIDFIAEITSDNIYLQYDCYHMQVMEGNLAPTLEKYLTQIAHIQLADNPGRHEPGTGEINYAFLLKHLDELGYDGWIGCEYIPKTGTEEGLGWVRPYLNA